MIYDKLTALDMVKGRLDILPENKTRDTQLMMRIDSAVGLLKQKGIRIEFEGCENGFDAADLMLVVDLTVWMIQNRDKGEDDPLWLRKRLGERWMSERMEET